VNCAKFQILILSAVKIYKQFLQTASASSDSIPEFHPIQGSPFPTPQEPWAIVL